MIEKWLELKEWEGYFISNTGKVKKIERMVALCPNKNRSNYVYVYHHDNKIKPRALSVHRLVARYFIANPENKPCVNHIDNNTQNNTQSNLEWVTYKENVHHTMKQGRQVQLVGSACKNAILNEEKVSEIKKLRGKKTYVRIAEQFGCTYSTVAHIMRGSQWKHVL